jgi:hypothetical protein
MGLLSVIEPLGGRTLNSQRVRKQANDDTEGKNDDAVEDGQQYSCLKVSYRVGHTFPCPLRALQHKVVLEKRVDEGSDSRTLCQNDNHAEKEKSNQYRHKPPSLTAPKE